MHEVLHRTSPRSPGLYDAQFYETIFVTNVRQTFCVQHVGHETFEQCQFNKFTYSTTLYISLIEAKFFCAF